MKTLSPLWLAALLLIPIADALPQGSGEAPPGSADQPPGDARGPQDPEADQGRAAPLESEPSQPEALPPMTLEDARLNFPTVVESFIAGVSPNGYWLLKEKGTDHTWKLKLVSIDTKTLRGAGAQRYSAPAVLRDVRDGQRLRVEFTVDFSGDQWKVAGMRLRPRKSGKRRR